MREGETGSRIGEGKVVPVLNKVPRHENL